ncbi:MAG: hypothetical protein GC155_14110 [Alphaproteobacteria bacterium]|nr:hypothetical protein [Alphaproteobacteria bacterium]
MAVARRLLAGFLLALCVSGAAWAEPRLFSRDDYVLYFAPGRFETRSTYYGSHGVMEVLKNRTGANGARATLAQTTRSLDVSANYDVLSARSFYKIVSTSVQDMVWDDVRKLYVYGYSDRDFDTNDSVVWESLDDRIEVSKDDIKRGLLHDFYKEADRRASRDVALLDRQYRHDVVGLWTMQCAYIRDNQYEVDCTMEHLPTHRIEHYFYRRLDLVS